MILVTTVASLLLTLLRTLLLPLGYWCPDVSRFTLGFGVITCICIGNDEAVVNTHCGTGAAAGDGVVNGSIND